MQTRRLCAIGPRRGGERGCWRRAEERAGASPGAESPAPALSPRRRSGAPGPGAKRRAGPGPDAGGRRGEVDGGAPRTGSARRAARSPRRRALSPGGLRSPAAAAARDQLRDRCQTPGDPPPNVGHEYLTPPAPATHTLKHAHAPRAPQTRRRRKRGNFGGMRVDPQVRLENRGPGALPAGVRAEIAPGRCDPGSRAECGFSPPPPPAPYPTPPGCFQVHQGTRGDGRKRSAQAGAAGHAGLLRRRRKWWGPRAATQGEAPTCCRSLSSARGPAPAGRSLRVAG